MYRKSKYKTNASIRQPYSGSRRFDRTCRNNGSCGWCRHNRTYQVRRERLYADMAIQEYYARVAQLGEQVFCED